MVNLIWDLKDDRFTDALVEIAGNGKTYRRFDDETEATLRKCFHALKAIDSEKARRAVQNLIDSKNPNILAILDMYE